MSSTRKTAHGVRSITEILAFGDVLVVGLRQDRDPKVLTVRKEDLPLALLVVENNRDSAELVSLTPC